MAERRRTPPRSRKSRAKGRTADQQFATAKRRIEEAKRNGIAKLDLSGLTKLSGLPPELAALTALQSLNLNRTQVSDLTPIAGLTALQSLNLNRTHVSDLTPIAGLTALQILNLRGTQISDLAPIAALTAVHFLNLSGTPISDLTPIANLTALQLLYLMDTRVKDLAPIAGLTALQSLDLMDTQVSDLTPIAGLTALEFLDLRGTRVSDLAPIAAFTALQGLDLMDTQVSDLTPIAGLTALQSLDLRGTRVSDLAPITCLTALQGLDLRGTRASDLTPIAGLAALEFLDLRGTQVSDLAPIAGLAALEFLDLSGTQVSDLAPLAGVTALQGLDLSRTRVSDLTPIARLTGLADGVASHSLGLVYANSPAAQTPPFDRLVGLEQPECTVESVNAVRGRLGLAEHIPEGYESPTELPSPTTIDLDEEDPGQDSEVLQQKPASHSFAFRRGRIEAQPQSTPPRHPDVASDIRNEVSEKSKEAAARLANCNAPRRITSTINRLVSSLGTSLEDVRAGILQMRFRSLEADIAAYDTDDGRRELPEDALAMLRDLASSVEDLMGCFPQLADIEAERLAQRLKDVDVPKIMAALAGIREAAEESEGVAPSAIEALRAGEPELEHDAQIIDSGASETARIAALNARDRTVGYMLLVYRNFIAGAVKAGGELAGLGSETWKEVRKKAPDQLSDAAVALVIAGLVNALLGPTSAIGAFALSFKPLRDRAKRVADKLTSAMRKRRPSSSKETHD